jgi:hypothetical protein
MSYICKFWFCNIYVKYKQYVKYDKYTEYVKYAEYAEYNKYVQYVKYNKYVKYDKYEEKSKMFWKNQLTWMCVYACDSSVEAEVRKGRQRLGRLQVVVREQLGPQLGYKAMMEWGSARDL